MNIRLAVQGDGSEDGLAELADWLRHEPELQGLVSPVPAHPRPGELGAMSDALVAAVGGGGALSVLAASLKAFLGQPRRSDVRIVLSGPDGRQVEIDAKRVSDVDSLVRQALGEVDE